MITFLSLETAKQYYKQCLVDTDWSVLPDVEPILENRQEFVNYRTLMRNLYEHPSLMCSFEKPKAVWKQPVVSIQE